MTRFTCATCRKRIVRWDGGLCYTCWHRIDFGRRAGKPVALFGQLELFPDGEVEKREAVT